MSSRGGFNEARFMEHFNDLIKERNLEQALSYLIAALPNIAESNMNRKEKLKHLTFAGRRLQNAGLGKYGVVKLKNKAKNAAETVIEHGLPDKECFVDFGCGAHEPIALSSYFYSNGFEKCIANDFLPIRSPQYAALSMYDIIVYMRNFPGEFASLGQDEQTFCDRMSNFDLKAFFQGDFEGGLHTLRENIKFLSCDILDSPILKNSVSYLVSFAVFEHVMEIEKVCNHLFHITKPGGINRHSIDLADHRAYRHDGSYNKFSFLTEQKSPSNLNRLRASEHVSAFEAAGFDVLKVDRRKEEIPEETWRGFLPRWREMSEDDQKTVGITITLRKP